MRAKLWETSWSAKQLFYTSSVYIYVISKYSQLFSTTFPCNPSPVQAKVTKNLHVYVCNLIITFVTNKDGSNRDSNSRINKSCKRAW